MGYFGKQRTPLLILFIIFSFLILLSISKWFYNSQEKQLRNNVENELLTIAELKVGQIHNWRQDQISNMTSHIEGILLKTILNWMANHQQSDADQILSEFRSLKKSYDYRQVLLIDSLGKMLLCVPDSVTVDNTAKNELSNAFRSHKPILTDLHTHKNGVVHLGIIIPIFSKNGQLPLCAVVAMVDAQKYLYPLMQSWPVPSQTAETLLVRRSDNDVLFLNELRHQKGTALKLRIPLTETDIPAVIAALGQEGIVYGKDYRGVNVLAALQTVPDSNWSMVAKIDTSEALASWNFRSILILSLFIAMVVMLIFSFIFAWQINSRRYYQNLYLAEASQRQSEEKFRAMFETISDLIIISEMDSEKIVEYNDKLIGYTRDEIIGLTELTLRYDATSFIYLIGKDFIASSYSPATSDNAKSR